ncbi:MAG TPA: prepilin-type N-terminal cleavage/methylation domain-containing protein [Myxococcaceae bacterium]|jgi:prepilin-type N-terminal cleavage/methylation domain-containing protein|nr:prepilin-type N-terminal cleavage/methylation domain-containing protein [Myxococcaceae bacterium]
MSARPTDRPRGFTIIELLTATAVGAVILLAALAAFDLQRQFSRNTERLLGSESNAALALTMMQRDMENAGYHFHGGPSDAGGYTWAAVVRPYDNLGTNIVTLKNDPFGFSTLSSADAGGAGFLSRTDAFEVLIGSGSNNPNRLASQVMGISGGGSVLTVNISPDPFNPAEIVAAGTADGPLMMFWAPGRHCMGRVTSYTSASANVARVTVSTVDGDLANSSTAWTAGCPAPQQRAEVFAGRRRYLVYENAAAPGQPAQVGLYVQTNNCDPFAYDAGQSCSSILGAPRLVAGGVDDMQIAWHVPAGMADGGTVDGWCQISLTQPTCGFDQPGTWNTPLAANIYGAQIFVASQGPEPLIRIGDGKPQLLNRLPEPGDNIARTVMQTSVVFRNQVVP